MASRVTRWNGDQVIAQVQGNAAKALGEIGLRAEGHAKKELYKGHGVITSTLRRSIHTAEPGYNWSADDIEPSDGTPELGGLNVEAAKTDDGLVVQLGSGLRYAMPVHQGHQGFEGYHFLTIGVEKVKAEVDVVVRKFGLKR